MPLRSHRIEYSVCTIQMESKQDRYLGQLWKLYNISRSNPQPLEQLHCMDNLIIIAEIKNTFFLAYISEEFKTVSHK